MHLTDLLIGLAASAVLLSACLTVLDHGQRTSALGAARAEAQQAARLALERLAGDLRGAGAGSDRELAAIATALPAEVVVQSDLDGDGSVAARGEVVVWRESGGVLRRDAGGGAQPVANGVRRLRLTYRDADGVETADPARVRGIAIVLDVEAGPGSLTTLATEVRLRNR